MNKNGYSFINNTDLSFSFVSKGKQGEILKEQDPQLLRQHLPALAGMSDSEIKNHADRMIRFANSPHPLQGLWDSHGRPIET